MRKRNRNMDMFVVFFCLYPYLSYVDGLIEMIWALCGCWLFLIGFFFTVVVAVVSFTFVCLAKCHCVKYTYKRRYHLVCDDMQARDWYFFHFAALSFGVSGVLLLPNGSGCLTRSNVICLVSVLKRHLMLWVGAGTFKSLTYTSWPCVFFVFVLAHLSFRLATTYAP